MSTPTPSAALISEARRLLDAATPGPWYVEPSRMLLAGVTPKIFGPGRCSYCERHGEPIWTGRTDINGRLVDAHVHEDRDGYDSGGHRVLAWPNYPAPAETEVCTNYDYDYEEGGVVDPADAAFIAAAPDLVRRLPHALEAAEKERDEAQMEFADCLLDRDRWRHRAEEAEADADKLAESVGWLIDPIPYDSGTSRAVARQVLDGHAAAIAKRSEP